MSFETCLQYTSMVRRLWDNIWSQFKSYGLLLKKKKNVLVASIFPLFFLYWEISGNINESNNIQILKTQSRVAHFKFYNVEEI